MKTQELTRMDLSQQGGRQRPTSEKQGRQKETLICLKLGLQLCAQGFSKSLS